MSTVFSTALALVFCTSLGLPSASAAESAKRRVLVIGIDGARGDLIEKRALEDQAAPTIQQLMYDGTFARCAWHLDPRCAKAQSGPRSGPDYYWKTGPGWASVLTGVDNSVHGVKNNEHSDLAVFSKTSAEHPTFFKALRESGFETAAGGVATFLTAKAGLKNKPGVLDYECGTGSDGPLVQPTDTSSCNLSARLALPCYDPQRDALLARWLGDRIRDPRFSAVMGVFDRVDETGHKYGFSDNKSYLKAITAVDALIGPLLQAVREGVQKRGEEWLVVLTSDHGGHKRPLYGDHSQVAGEDEAIPFIVASYGSEKKPALPKPPISHTGVHALVLDWLKLNTSGH